MIWLSFYRKRKESLHIMHFENKDLGIWAIAKEDQVVHSKAGIKIKTSHLHFSINYACVTVLTGGGVTVNDALLLLTRITKFLVGCIVEPLPPGLLEHSFDSGHFVLVHMWVLYKTFTWNWKNNFNCKGGCRVSENVDRCMLGRASWC